MSASPPVSLGRSKRVEADKPRATLHFGTPAVYLTQGDMIDKRKNKVLEGIRDQERKEKDKQERERIKVLNLEKKERDKAEKKARAVAEREVKDLMTSERRARKANEKAAKKCQREVNCASEQSGKTKKARRPRPSSTLSSPVAAYKASRSSSLNRKENPCVPNHLVFTVLALIFSTIYFSI